MRFYNVDEINQIPIVEVAIRLGLTIDRNNKLFVSYIMKKHQAFRSIKKITIGNASDAMQAEVLLS